MLGRALIALATLLGALVALLAVLAAFGVLHAYRIPSSSMEPTFHCARPGAGCRAAHGDRVVALKYVLGSPARGDIVAFTTPPLAAVRCGAGGTFVKRIVGLPGDRWEERQGRVYLDGKPLAEPYVAAEDRDSRTIAPVTIPSGRYFLLGDNRSSSCDSRSWGSVRRSSLIGKVVVTYWPVGRFAIR